MIEYLSELIVSFIIDTGVISFPPNTDFTILGERPEINAVPDSLHLTGKFLFLD
jgi:hypothetical protein